MGSENTSWEVEEGVPQPHDPFIQKFLAGRNALVREEEQRRHDFNLRHALPPSAVRACEIVAHIRDRELKRLDSTTSNQDAPWSDQIPNPGLLSGQDREAIVNSDLWKIVQNMPKGSLLHGFLPAMVDTDFLIDQALTTPGIHIFAPSPLITHNDFENASFAFQYSSRLIEESENKASLWSSDYEQSALVGLQSAAFSFPQGGETGFRNWLQRRCCLMPKRLPYRGRGSSAIPDLFNCYLPIINSLLHCEPILRISLRRIFSQLAADRISYVEFRAIFHSNYEKVGSEEVERDYLEWCRVFKEEVELFKSSEEGQGFHDARVIWTTFRRLSNKDIGQSMTQCILLKKEFPGVICGFDLVGDEDHERPLADLLPILFWFRGHCSAEGLEIPFFFHAGECLGDGDQADQNLFDAVLLGTRRIAHGLSLYKHPLLLDVIKNKQILVECCPSSDASLGLTNSFKSHPFPALIARGVPVTLCNDSPGLLGDGTKGLTPEFWQALLAFKNMGLTGLAMMVESSIRWSCFEDQKSKDWLSDIHEGILGERVKGARLQRFYAEFEGFCEWVVQEFETTVDE